MPHFVLLPAGGALVIHVFNGGRPEPIAPVPGDDVRCARLSDDGVHLGVLDQGGRRAAVFRVTRTGVEPLGAPAPLEPGREASVIAMKGPVLYAATPGPRARIHVLGEGRWTVVALPVECCGEGKSVDELLIDGDRLIAVDDVVLPKYFVRFAISAEGALLAPELSEIPAHTAWERIRAAALGERWVALLSGGTTRAGRTDHLALYDRATLSERANLSQALDRGGAERWTGVAFADEERLYLGCGRAGLGALNLRGLDPQALPALSPRGLAGPADGALPRIEVIDLGAPVVGLVTVPGSTGCFALLSDDTYRWVGPRNF